MSVRGLLKERVNQNRTTDEEPPGFDYVTVSLIQIIFISSLLTGITSLNFQKSNLQKVQLFEKKVSHQNPSLF